MSAAAARELAQGNALRQAGRIEEATAAYRRAVELAPSSADAHYNLGIALRQAGDRRGAVLEFRTAARLDPRDMDAVQNAVETLAQAAERGERPFPWTCPAQEPATPVSIVVCSIDERRLEGMRASFVAALGAREHEFIVIRDARSLGEAYERGARGARHDWIVFSHDDVALASERPFEALQRALESHDLVGLAGADLANGPATLWAGHPHLFGGVAYPVQGGWKAAVYSLRTGVLGGMQTLDGMLFAARREAVLRVGFDATTFDGFHFYDLDFVYRAHVCGCRVAVTTEVLAIHASEGRFDDAWRKYGERFMRKFPALCARQGPSFYFGRELGSREALVRFHEAFNGLGAQP